MLDFNFIHHKWNKHPISTFEFWNVQVLCGELVSENENYVWHAIANAASVCVRSMEHQVVFFSHPSGSTVQHQVQPRLKEARAGQTSSKQKYVSAPLPAMP